MLETLRSYLDKDKYYIIFTNNNIYIKNYTKLISITQEEILFTIENITMKINGKNLYLKKSLNKELLIEGSIESIKKYDNN